MQPLTSLLLMMVLLLVLMMMVLFLPLLRTKRIVMTMMMTMMTMMIRRRMTAAWTPLIPPLSLPTPQIRRLYSPTRTLMHSNPLSRLQSTHHHQKKPHFPFSPWFNPLLMRTLVHSSHHSHSPSTQLLWPSQPLNLRFHLPTMHHLMLSSHRSHPPRPHPLVKSPVKSPVKIFSRR